MNYYVDENGLEIKEKNIYTATEIATLLPLRGSKSFEELFLCNSWSKFFLPNHTMKISYTKETETGVLKKTVEWLLNNSLRL